MVKISDHCKCCPCNYNIHELCKCSKRDGSWFWLGGAHYFGDLNNLYRLNEPGLAGGATARFNFNHRLSVRGQLNYARVRAHDSKSTNAFDLRRNLSFYSNILEFAPAVEINFLNIITEQKKRDLRLICMVVIVFLFQS